VALAALLLRRLVPRGSPLARCRPAVPIRVLRGNPWSTSFWISERDALRPHRRALRAAA
jgi:hypothetical protein